MSTIELKEKLYQYIDTASDEELQKLNAYVEDDPIVGYTIEGEPIRAKAFKEEARAARAEIKKGNFITLDELKEDMKTW